MRPNTNKHIGKGLARWLNKLPGWSAIRDANKGRTTVQAERGNEDSLHSNYAQVKLIATQREVFRNGVMSPASALQLQLNTVGTVGGRLTVTTDDEEFNKTAGRVWRRWARHAEFIKGKPLTEVLQACLCCLSHNGGDFIAVMDDGILTGGHGSGKVRIFESDEIGNVPQAYLEKQFGENYTQSRGVVLDQFGRVAGAFVSASQRGKDEFDPDKTITLRLSTPADFTDSNWFYVSNDWRVGDAQIRGVATVTHIANALDDIASIKASELGAAKLNASIGIVVSDKDSQAENADLERGLPPINPCPCDDAENGEGNGSGTADGNAEPPPPPPAATIKGLREQQAAIIDVSPGKQVSSFATDRPNTNVSQYVRDELNDAVTVFGLSPAYRTLAPDASYSAARAAIQLSSRAFQNLQKKLERNLLDALCIRVLKWHGLTLPDNVDECLMWSWPSVIEIDQEKKEKSVAAAFSNCRTSLKKELGADWEAQLEQIRWEAAVAQFGREHAKEHLAEIVIPHPALRTGNGTIAEQRDVPPTEGEEPENTPVETQEGEAN